MFSSQYIEAYLEFMIDIATDLRGDGDREAVAAEMQEVLNFEIKIAEVSIIYVLSMFLVNITFSAI